jgi:hypothetical protein
MAVLKQITLGRVSLAIAAVLPFLVLAGAWPRPVVVEHVIVQKKDWSTDFQPHVGVHTPGEGTLYHRKHRLRCPIQTEHVRWCRGGSSSHAPHSFSGPSTSLTVCAGLRVEYKLRHPGRPPRSLRWVHGCRRWRLDAEYHRRVQLNPSWSLIGLVLGL